MDSYVKDFIKSELNLNPGALIEFGAVWARFKAWRPDDARDIGRTKFRNALRAAGVQLGRVGGATGQVFVADVTLRAGRRHQLAGEVLVSAE